MAAIDIGSAAIDRNGGMSAGSTCITALNVANDTGFLTTFEVFATGSVCVGLKVGTFSGSGTSYDDRDYEFFGNIAYDSKQTFTGRNCDVVTGDLLGFYFASGGNLELSQVGEGGNFYTLTGSWFGAGSKTYTNIGTYTASFYATGSTDTPPVAIDRVGSVFSTQGTDTWPTSAYGSPGTGANRCLIIGVEIEGTASPNCTAVSYGGQAATLIDAIQCGTTTIQLVQLWRVMESGIAAQSGGAITGTLAGTVQYITVHAQMYNNTDQTSPVLQIVKDSSNASTPNPLTTVDITASAYGMVLSFAGNGGSSYADWNVLIELTDVATSSSTGSYADRATYSGGAIACQCTWGAQTRTAQITVELGCSVVASPSQSPSLSPSASASPSISPSISPSKSPSQSPSLSPSASPSLSPSASASPSISPSISPSKSPSQSPSLSPSASPSKSPSASPSLSPSQSPSASPSLSSSKSPSLSPSASLSPSLSPSESPSPSPGYQGYTRGNYLPLPTNDNDLETTYSAQDIIDVAIIDAIRVSQSADRGAYAENAEYAVNQFKEYAGAEDRVNVTWYGRTNCSPTTSTVYLQIYNRNSTTWETIDSNNSSLANTDFTLEAEVVGLTNYKDGNTVVSFRVYQRAGVI